MRTLLTAAALSATLLTAQAEGEFRHIVMFKFKPEATEAQIKDIEKSFAGLQTKIETIDSFEWGTTENIEPLNDGFTHCFVVTFKDKKGLEIYLPHPDHTAFVTKLKPLLDKALVFDYTAKKD